MKIKFHTAICAALFGGTLFSWAAPAAEPVTLISGAEVRDISVTHKRDSVYISMRFILDGMKVKSNRAVVLTPVLAGGGSERALPPVEVMGGRRNIYYQRNGEKAYAEHASAVVKKERKGAQTIDYKTSLAYAGWMDNVRLYISEDLCGCGKPLAQNSTDLTGADLAVRPQLAYVQPPVERVKVREIKGTAYLDFRLDDTRIDADYRRNPQELAAIGAIIDTVSSNANIRVTGIVITGYASPEGPEEHNDELARDRTRALKEYVSRRYAFADSLFTLRHVAEDWEGLRRYVEQSDLKDKTVILSTIDDPRFADKADAREWRIRQEAPESYAYLAEHVYPSLRRSEYEIDYRVRGFNIDEAREVLRSRPQDLSLQEMFAVAQTYGKGTKEFDDIFATAVRIYPDDEVANLNVANTLLSEGDAEAAMKYLPKAGGSPEADNARGAACLLLGRWDEARRYLRAAADAGLAEARHNLGYVE